MNPSSARTERFGEALDGFGKALFEETGALRSDPTEIGRDWGCGQHEHEGNDGEENSGDCGRDEHMVGVGDVESQDVEGDMFERLDVTERGEREEREEDRKRRESDKSDVEAAMESLTGAAAIAIGEVLLVVPSHLRRDS